MILCAVASTLFSVIGPDILGKATTELANGLMAKIQGTGGIDFTKIGQILLFVLGLYLLSTLFSFVQGWLMTGVTQKVCYRMRKEISEKIDRMPMAYFESRTYGEVLSRITNDVDTLGQSSEPEHYPDHHLCGNHDWRTGHDAAHLAADDADRSDHSAHFRDADLLWWSRKSQKYFTRAAGISGTYQRSGRGSPMPVTLVIQAYNKEKDTVRPVSGDKRYPV